MTPAILDSIESIKQLDSQSMLASIELLCEQMESVFAEAHSVKMPVGYRRAKQIVVCGMGGSTLGAHVIKSLLFEKLPVPLEIVNGYELPAYAGRQTLVIVSSYSGTTEEALSCFTQARKKKTLLLAITSDGDLVQWSRKYRVPALVFSTDKNPCRSPRMGLGYSLVGQLTLLAKLGFTAFTARDLKRITDVVARASDRFGVDVPTETNLAKQLAAKTPGRSVWFVASEHLVGSAHIGANQMNENAKRFAGYFAIPELNHHLMEGMMQPVANRDHLLMLLFHSKLYDSRVSKRYGVTRAVLDRNTVHHETLELIEKTPLEQAVETLVFTSYLSYYAALVEGIDPTAIPFVDFFKEQLKKHS